MIRSFRDKATRVLFETGKSRHYSAFTKVAERKLQQLDAAESLAFLAAPPGNRLEALQGDRKGQHSIRINSQFRICFRWTELGPENVEITDCH